MRHLPAILATAGFTDIRFLWYNVICCLVVIAATLLTNGPVRHEPPGVIGR